MSPWWQNTSEQRKCLRVFSGTLAAVVIYGGVQRAGNSHGTAFLHFSLLSHMQDQLKIQSALVKSALAGQLR